MKIYKSNGAILMDVPVDDNSYRHREIMGDNSLTLYFSLAEHFEIPLGAYVEFEGELYNEDGENNSRAYTNIKLAHDNINTVFYKDSTINEHENFD